MFMFELPTERSVKERYVSDNISSCRVTLTNNIISILFSSGFGLGCMNSYRYWIVRVTFLKHDDCSFLPHPRFLFQL